MPVKRHIEATCDCCSRKHSFMMISGTENETILLQNGWAIFESTPFIAEYCKILCPTCKSFFLQIRSFTFVDRLPSFQVESISLKIDVRILNVGQSMPSTPKEEDQTIEVDHGKEQVK